MNRMTAGGCFYDIGEIRVHTFLNVTQPINARFTPDLYLPNPDNGFTARQYMTGVCGVAAGLPVNWSSDSFRKETADMERSLHPGKVRGG